MAAQQAMYGYQDDDVKQGSGLRFGLNAANVRLVKFEWINDAGKDGAEAEALDIQFMIEGGDRAISFRKFPITKTFDPAGGEITDPNHPVFQKAVRDFNALLMHIMHCFIEKDVLQQALATPIASFKEFCRTLTSMLPKDYDQTPLDMFGQWQWQMTGENKRTYLDLPKKMSYGRWLCPAVSPVGEWKEVRKENPTATDLVALKYVDDEGNIHPFKRNGWFMLSNFAHEQIAEQSENASGGYQPGASEEKTKWEQEEVASSESGAAAETVTDKVEETKESQSQSWNDLANQQ